LQEALAEVPEHQIARPCAARMSFRFMS